MATHDLSFRLAYDKDVDYRAFGALHTTTVEVEVDVDVEFYYTPGEPATRDCPGCSAEIELEKVIIDGANVDLKELTDDERERLEEEIWEQKGKGD